MDQQQFIEEKNKLERVFKEFARTCNFSEEQEKKIFKDFEEAIMLNIIDKLFEQLSTKQKEQMKQQKFKDFGRLIDFLSESVSKDTLTQVSQLAAEEVTKEFLERL